MRIAIGTRKGLWTAVTDGTGWSVSQPLKAMAEFSSVTWLDRGPDLTPRLLAGARSWFWGPSIMSSDDDGLTWTEPEDGAIAFPAGLEAAVARVWTLTPDPRTQDVVWAGCEPHSLWRSEDGGRHFELNQALWNHPHRTQWMAGAGGGAVHTIVPRSDASMAVALSTGGCYISADSATEWQSASRGIRAEFMPDQYPEFNQCVHRIAMDATDQDRLYAQNHGGVFLTEDSGGSWREITDGLPATFGFVVLAHPVLARTAWVIPIDAATMFPPQAQLRLWRTDDAGTSWREVGAGLPDQMFTSVLRDAAHVMPHEDGCAIAFGTRSGCVYVSVDSGDTFEEVAHSLPDVLSVRLSP